MSRIILYVAIGITSSELSTLKALEKELASLMEQKQIHERHWARQEDAYKDSFKEAQKAKDP